VSLQMAVTLGSEHQRNVVVHVVAIPLTLGFFRGQFKYLQENGWDVHVISSEGPFLEEFCAEENVSAHPVTIERRPAPIRDLAALLRLVWMLTTLRPALVHAHTPKAGLLAMLAARVSGCDVRVYHMHGLRYSAAYGWKRRLLSMLEKLTCRLATQVFCVSQSVRAASVKEGICAEGKIKVLVNGSINGVDARARFNPAKFDDAALLSARRRFGIPSDGLTIGFMGRITRDKGIEELLAVWQILRAEIENAYLVLVGPDDGTDRLSLSVQHALSDDPRVKRTGFISDTPEAYAVFDVLCLPSYREGFPVSLLEAAAMEVPTVASDIPGCSEAIEHGVTGKLCPVGDVESLAGALREYLTNECARESDGRRARQRVLARFAPEPLWRSVLNEYCSLTQQFNGLKNVTEHVS
jgi:glycosyltransferase involved in cell wall biosynthesis